MAERPARSQVALSRQVENDRIAAFICALSPRVRAARRQISNDRESGEGRCARLKCRTLRRDRNESDIAEMLDRSERKRHRQERCAGQE
jgi:hypothetical protein